jgi:RNA polymerase sigma factor (TIGR02999 family)
MIGIMPKPRSPADSETRDITMLLGDWRQGDPSALDRLLPLVYDHLRKIANQMMRHERPGQTLDATALVHEAWFRLRVANQPDLRDRIHFIAVAARQMRHVLIDHARAKMTEKRGSDWDRVTISGLDAAPSSASSIESLAALHLAFERLQQLDPRKTQVAELFLFGGMNASEVAEALQLSTATVNRDWAFARSFLQKELGGS